MAASADTPWQSIRFSKVGFLEKRGEIRKAWKNRLFGLCAENETLYYCRTRKQLQAFAADPSSKSVLSGEILLSRASLYIADYMDPKRKYCLEICTRSRNFFLLAKDAVELKSWIQALLGAGARFKSPYEGPHPFTGPLTGPCHVGMHGYLQKKGKFNKGYKKRYFRTMHTAHGFVLAYFDVADDAKPKGTIVIDGTSSVVDPLNKSPRSLSRSVSGSQITVTAPSEGPTEDKAFEFCLITSQRTFELKADSAASKKLWMMVLQKLTVSSGEESDLPSVAEDGREGDEDIPGFAKLLQVSPNASSDEIIQAYCQLARVLHPENNKDPESARKFAEVTQAYFVLLNRQTRRTSSSSPSTSGPQRSLSVSSGPGDRRRSSTKDRTALPLSNAASRSASVSSLAPPTLFATENSPSPQPSTSMPAIPETSSRQSPSPTDKEKDSEDSGRVSPNPSTDPAAYARAKHRLDSKTSLALLSSKYGLTMPAPASTQPPPAETKQRSSSSADNLASALASVAAGNFLKPSASTDSITSTQSSPALPPSTDPAATSLAAAGLSASSSATSLRERRRQISARWKPMDFVSLNASGVSVPAGPGQVFYRVAGASTSSSAASTAAPSTQASTEPAKPAAATTTVTPAPASPPKAEAKAAPASPPKADSKPVAPAAVAGVATSDNKKADKPSESDKDKPKPASAPAEPAAAITKSDSSDSIGSNSSGGKRAISASQAALQSRHEQTMAALAALQKQRKSNLQAAPAAAADEETEPHEIEDTIEEEDEDGGGAEEEADEEIGDGYVRRGSVELKIAPSGDDNGDGEDADFDAEEDEFGSFAAGGGSEQGSGYDDDPLAVLENFQGTELSVIDEENDDTLSLGSVDSQVSHGSLGSVDDDSDNEGGFGTAIPASPHASPDAKSASASSSRSKDDLSLKVSSASEKEEEKGFDILALADSLSKLGFDKAAVLLKLGARGRAWQPRLFLLSSKQKMLVEFVSREDFAQYVKYHDARFAAATFSVLHSTLYVYSASETIDPQQRFCMEVSTVDQSYLLAFESVEPLKDWVNSLCAAGSRLKTVHKSHPILGDLPVDKTFGKHGYLWKRNSSGVLKRRFFRTMRSAELGRYIGYFTDASDTEPIGVIPAALDTKITVRPNGIEFAIDAKSKHYDLSSSADPETSQKNKSDPSTLNGREWVFVLEELKSGRTLPL